MSPEAGGGLRLLCTDRGVGLGVHSGLSCGEIQGRRAGVESLLPKGRKQGESEAS